MDSLISIIIKINMPKIYLIFEIKLYCLYIQVNNAFNKIESF